MAKGTGYFYNDNAEICVGDIVMRDGYMILVCEYNDEPDKFYGSLICEIGNSCRNIHYAVCNGGESVYKVNRSNK